MSAPCAYTPKFVQTTFSLQPLTASLARVRVYTKVCANYLQPSAIDRLVYDVGRYICEYYIRL